MPDRDADDAEVVTVDDADDSSDVVAAETLGDGALAQPETTVPKQLVALPLNQRPVFPSMMLPLVLLPGHLAECARIAKEHHDGWLGFFLTHEASDDPEQYTAGDLHHIGAAARIVKMADHESGGVQILAQVVARYAITTTIVDEPVLIVGGHVLRSEVDREDPEIRAYAMAIVTALKDLVEHNPVFADEIRMVLANYNNIDGPGRLADLAATLTTAGRDDLQQVLEQMSIPARMERVLVMLARERQLAELKGKIQNQINEKVSDHQRKFFLNEQLKAIKEELGIETDGKSLEIQRFRERLEAVAEPSPPRPAKRSTTNCANLNCSSQPALSTVCRATAWTGCWPCHGARCRGQPRPRRAPCRIGRRSPWPG